MARLKILRKEIDYFVAKLQKEEHFALAGYSDAEWYCMMGIREGERTGLGQILNKEYGLQLSAVMRDRQNDKNFLFAVPECLQKLPEFGSNRLEKYMDRFDFTITAYERDMILDDLAKNAGLFSLIQQLQKMKVIIIGNEDLRGLDFLQYSKFIPISSPNVHLEEDGITNACNETLKHVTSSTVCLISAGVSAAVIIDELYDVKPDNFYIDCGSIWDAFVGIGGQRSWRAELYANPDKLEQWKNDNILGKD